MNLNIENKDGERGRKVKEEQYFHVETLLAVSLTPQWVGGNPEEEMYWGFVRWNEGGRPETGGDSSVLFRPQAC